MFNWFSKKQELEKVPEKERESFWSTDITPKKSQLTQNLLAELAKVQPPRTGDYAMDDNNGNVAPFKQNYNVNPISQNLTDWYAGQTFIGHQLCGVLSQNWLIDKACSVPASDAIRKGYFVASVDGEDVPDETTALIHKYDKKYRLNWHMKQFIRKGRIFGVRIAMFKVESTDPQYYEKPFNIDGVTPGSYKGIVQIDPYWTAPLLDQEGAGNPASLHFYEPTWWLIQGKKVHRTHLVIYRYSEPIDILKPVYLYGGIPLTQLIMERVYAAEKTANEAPQLAMTKRTSIWLTDLERVFSDVSKSIGLLDWWSQMRNNYGVKLGDKDGDEFQQFDTSLADLDAVIMSQYQLVAATANMPATKLLGTSPKGFGASGEYEVESYHETLETIQDELSPMLERHHKLVLKSFGNGAEQELTINWNPLDTPTAEQLAMTNKAKAETGALLIQAGVLDSQDERNRIAKDKTSGYNELGLSENAPGLPEQNPYEEGQESETFLDEDEANPKKPA